MDDSHVFQDHRRSTRVPLDISIEVHGEIGTVKGVTVVVNLHGALIRLVRQVPLRANITITVYIAGKSAFAKVVYVCTENPLVCGIIDASDVGLDLQFR